MISLDVLFGMLVVLFTLIGAMRGWAKELLVTSALILALFLNAILDGYVEPYRAALLLQPGSTQVTIRAGLIVLLAIFGYQTPNIRALQPKLARERLEEVLLGSLLGGLNGYLMIGSIWFYLHQSGYPTDLVLAPEQGTELAMRMVELMDKMPPAVLTVPQVYFAVGLVFVFIIVVFV
jgi:hypothetical protein